MSCGVRITSSPSLPGSAAAIASACAYRSGVASPRTSIGLLWLHAAGRTAFRRPRDSGDSSASSPPPATSASVASTPGPPALVTIVRRRPIGRGCLPSISARSNTSSIAFTRSTPARLKAASSTSSAPVSAPVCDVAARLAASLRPALMTMIGFVKATSRAADRNARASPIDSM